MVGATFEWDPAKDADNQAKHGVAFAEAQYVFADPRRVIAVDVAHSSSEQRFYCFGQVGGGVMTVRFTYGAASSALSAPDIGGKASVSMKKRIRYSDEALGNLRVVPDFLPPPDQLAFREDEVKVTLALSKRSVAFFKAEAKKHKTPYQRMIRRLVDAYVRRFSAR
jgi:uncharacterized DUF497 family protein